MHGHLKIKRHIFLTGATGYIGGSVLTRLLSHPLSDTFQTTVLVRDASKATQFRQMGVRAIVGSYSDLSLLTQLASDADLVLACADADDLNAAHAILNGLKVRYDKTGKIPSLIHTSGTGVLIDNAMGMHSSDVIYSDLDIKKLESLPETQPHRIVDLAIVGADAKGYVKTYIVLPSTIYGRAEGALVDAGLQNNRSQQIPGLVKRSLDLGRPVMVGEGQNIWPNVHINEVTDLYIHLVDLIIPHGTSPEHTPPHIDDSAFAHGASGYYFAENGEHTLYSICETIGKVMVDMKKTSDPRPRPLTESEAKKYYPDGGAMAGANARCRADRSRAIGWKPKKGTKDMLASIRLEFKP